MRRICLQLLLGLIAFCEATVVAQEPYKFLNEIQIGGEGGWDILTIDSSAHRLYLSHSTKVIVVDLNKNKVVGQIADTPGVHAFLAVPEFKRGFSSNGKENKSSVVDLTTLKTISKIDTGRNPDPIAYDSKRKEVYVFNHGESSATLIDAKEMKARAMIQLGGKPEFPVIDEVSGTIYCNLEDTSEIGVIDTAKHEVVRHWSVSPGEGPTGIALDAVHHRLFASCHNKMMVMLDTESGKVLANVPIGAGTDGAAFDDATQLVFASCGDGVVTIAKEESPDKLTVVQTLKTERSARTMAIDPKTHRIYLPTAQFQAAPSVALSTRQPIVPNTLKLLVYGPAESANH